MGADKWRTEGGKNCLELGQEQPNGTQPWAPTFCGSLMMLAAFPTNRPAKIDRSDWRAGRALTHNHRARR